MPSFILVHSPLVGPVTWTLVADELRGRGYEVRVPVLAAPASPPYWSEHAASAARSVEASYGAYVLVGHSGAGAILPAISQAIGRPPAGYVFVDAGIPRSGASRLQLLEAEAPELAGELAALLRAGGGFPDWDDATLAGLIPNPELRRTMIAQLRPQPLAFWEEPAEVFEGWPDAPCAYLQFTPGYDYPAEQAQQQGWLFARLEGGHFHMLVDPQRVADALVSLAERDGMLQ